MPRPRPAVHRTILAVDIEAFGSASRTDLHRKVIHDGLYLVLQRAFRASGIPWNRCNSEDRGDGVLLLAPPELPKAPFAEILPSALAATLREYNATHREQERIRLRVALHAGEVNYDSHGVVAASVNFTFRLLDSPPLRAALAGSAGVLALIASAWFFDEVIRHAAAGPASYRRVRVDVKETSTIAWIALPDHPYPPDEDGLEIPSADSGVAVPHQLPAYTAHFAGRARELAALTDLLDTADIRRTAGMVVISAIGGTAGIGKTTLALRWAHKVAGRFPDGQLYINLRGFDPSGSPVTPAEAVRCFLDALGVEPGRIPAHLDAQAALYRSLIADRRILMVLDNAYSSDQLRPLLPGDGTCLVLVTSRNQLTGLVAQEGARLLILDLLPEAEALELLEQRLGQQRVAADPEAADELIHLCARLPLALCIVAARATARPGFPLAALTAELQDADSRLDSFSGRDLATDLRAVFSWSYEQLSTAAARMFRLLGVHPGPDISVSAAASLAGIPSSQARMQLVSLREAHLVTEQTPGRYAFHDLLRAYAVSQAEEEDTPADRHAAICRVLDHYLHTGLAAVALLSPDRDPIDVKPAQPGVFLESFGNHRMALDWFDAERSVLLVSIERALGEDFDTHAWQIAWALEVFLDRKGHWHDWAATQRTALAAAVRLSDHDWQSRSCRSLARAYSRLGLHEDACAQLHEALTLSEKFGDLASQARTHMGFSIVLERQGRQNEAINHARQALNKYRKLGNKDGQANALNSVGWLYARLGEHERALSYCQEALSLLQGLSDRSGEAATWDSLGYIHSQLHHDPEAFGCFEHALNLYQELGDRYYEARTLMHLGDAARAADSLDKTCDAWRQALTIFDELHHPDAEQIRDKLRGIGLSDKAAGN